jgi:hypothetical protein
VTATLVFNHDSQLIDFVSDDRLRASDDGKNFAHQRWSTPVAGYRTVGPRRFATDAQARWHAPAPEGEFAYLEFSIDGIAYNPKTDAVVGIV